jgi:DNA-binding transcriptional MerR regulator
MHAVPDLASHEPPLTGDEAPPATPDPPPTQQPVSFTVDELAAAAGLPVRTVRHYQSEKVLPPPERKGRIAVYGQAHLDRLLLIGRLQDRGLRLAAIRDAFKRVEKGELWLDDWLGLGDELRAPWSEERPAVLTEEELAERVSGRPGAVAALIDAGLVRRQRGLTSTYLVPSTGLLDIALELDAAGVDVDTAGAAAGTIRKHLRRASGDLVDFFLERVGSGFARRGSIDDYAEALDALRPLGARAVQLVFVQEIERALRHAVEQGRVTPTTPLSETTDRSASQPEHKQTGDS